MQTSNKLVENKEYAEHIELTFKNHPELTWSTKNIAPLGSRHIFYTSFETPECSCSASCLVVK